MYVRVFVGCIFITVVDGYYGVTGITVFSECFLEMVEFIFLGFSGIAICVDAVYECSDTADFVFSRVDLVRVRVLSVYLCLDRPLLGSG